MRTSSRKRRKLAVGVVLLALTGAGLLAGWKAGADQLMPVPACVDRDVLSTAADVVRQEVQSAQTIFSAREANFDAATGTRLCIGNVLVGGVPSRIRYTVRWDNRLIGAYYIEAELDDALLADIKNRTAADIERSYGLAKRNGSAIDQCSAAGLVAAAYQQAHNEAEYARWKKIEAADCVAAGVPR